MATLKLKAGNDEPVKFTFKKADGSARNLTGGTIVYKIAKKIGVTDLLALYFNDTITSFTDPTNGIHVEIIPDSVTSLWAVNGTYQHQARFIDSTGQVFSGDVESVAIQSNLIESL